MELKTARLTLLIDPNKKAAFERLCAQQDLTASQVVRQLIRDYLTEHGVQFVASGVEVIEDEAAGEAAPARGKPGPRHKRVSAGQPKAGRRRA
jgi:ribbon-helix-helix protein